MAISSEHFRSKKRIEAYNYLTSKGQKRQKYSNLKFYLTPGTNKLITEIEAKVSAGLNKTVGDKSVKNLRSQLNNVFFSQPIGEYTNNELNHKSKKNYFTLSNCRGCYV